MRGTTPLLPVLTPKAGQPAATGRGDPGVAMVGTRVGPAAQLEPQPRQELEAARELELTCMSNLLATAEARVYFKDLQSRFLLISAGWIAAYAPGRGMAELIGKTDFDVFSDQHAAAAFADEQQVIRTGEPIVAKVERETYDGHAAGRAAGWVSTTKMPLRDAGGRIIGTFGISRDVTARIRAEKGMVRQARKLRAQNERLRELDRLKDEFIGLVSHELRTPLVSVVGYVELLRDEGTSGPNADHFIEVIERGAQRGSGRHLRLRSGGNASGGSAEAHRPDPLRHRRALLRGRSDPHRPAARQPDLQRAEVHPGRRAGRGQARDGGRRGRTGGR
jgi:signal transduction histidine kinase